ncbi:hypothetical protein QBC32DRAFT_374333 [Pseudoneurospora amorphoporcata]|uniref:Uncharacterized protein n=1 Tax=Pseudoneurospora amorphoporcata TaxID=241081 RepID=A0AAN6NPE7_9PEZI|nr:hypothetical protein QBC32DRAFT_374333 [Pseudoneurospora amorphoporcata]
MELPVSRPVEARYITSHAHLIQRKATREAAAFNALVTGNVADFPTHPTDQYPLIDSMKAAMRDESDILDNPDNNAHINRIRATSDEDLEEKAWDLMFDAYDVQRGKRIPKLSTAYFPNYMDRFDALVALMRTKLSNNHTNKVREYNKDVKAAAKFSGRTTTAEDGTTRIYDAAGNLVKEFRRPEKRPLSELLGDRLTSIARPKRARTRTASGPTSSDSTNSSTPEEPVVEISGSLTPIQEEGEDVVGVAATRGGKELAMTADADNEEGATDEEEERLLSPAQGTEEDALGKAEKDDGHAAFEAPNGLTTPSLDAHLMANQHLPLGYQPYSSDQFPTPNQHEAVGEQSEQDSPDDYPASPSYEVDLLGERSGEDDGGQAALDGGARNNDRDRIGY